MWQSEMVDVSGLTLPELTALAERPDTPLAATLRRLAAERESPQEPVAGFNSAL